MSKRRRLSKAPLPKEPPEPRVCIIKGLKAAKCKNKKVRCDCIDCPRHILIGESYLTNPDFERSDLNWNEYFFGDSIARLFVDIDASVPEYTAEKHELVPEVIQEQDMAFRAKLLPTIMAKLGDNPCNIKEKDIAISTSTGFKPEKQHGILSYHLVVTTHACRFSRMGEILKRLGLGKDDHCSIFKHVDSSVYSPKGHALRLIHCCKGNYERNGVRINDTRKKRFVTHLRQQDFIPGTAEIPGNPRIRCHGL